MPKKRTYGRLKKELADQDAVLKEYLMQQGKRDAERDRKADERAVEEAKRADQRWLTVAQTFATTMAQTLATTMAMALNGDNAVAQTGNNNKRQRTESHGESN